MDSLAGSVLMSSSAFGIALSRRTVWPRRFKYILSPIAVLVILLAKFMDPMNPLRLVAIFLQLPAVSLAIASWSKFQVETDA